MAILGSYIQVVIRGLYNDQQWQVSPTYAITDVDGASPTSGNFNFIESELSDWFVAWWNGWGALPTNGMADAFVAVLPETVSINEVRVYAKTNVMALPAQALITGELNGGRGTGGDMLPSFTAVSAYARSLTYGRKGAAMRMPLLIDGDVEGNNINETARNTFQLNLLDRLTEQGTAAALETGFSINTEAGEILNVFAMRPCAVARVPSPTTGKPTFPYEGFANVSAVECAAWTLNPWASTQNSRKIGRGR